MKAPTLDDRKWRILAATIADVGKRIVKVGVMQSAGAEPDGTTLADIAAIHEFGAPKANIPERSFIRRTFRDQSSELGKICERAAKQIVLNGMSVDRALNLIGAWGAAAVKRTITKSDIPPPLAARTIEARARKHKQGSTKPLVDEGRLLGAITWAVADESEAKGGVEE